MSDFKSHLHAQIDQIAQSGLHRRLRTVESPQGIHLLQDGKSLLNFSSNDYLGLANHPALREAAIRAVERYGTGSGASRLISGSLAVHHQLEEALAGFKGTEAALAFPSGYSAAMGTIGAVCAKDDIIILDKLVHACIVDAARLCGARLRVFHHNDLNDLQSILEWAASKQSVRNDKPRVLIVTESVFSMDGDIAPLREIVELKERYGAWLMLDEAHGTGVFGPNGSGVAQRDGIAAQIEIQMGTLGKALGAAGGYICGSRELIELLINRARSFIFSTAPVPAAAAAARAGVELARSSEGNHLRNQLWNNVAETSKIIEPLNDPHEPAKSPIVPWIIGEEARAMQLADHLRETGIYSPAIRYPSVPLGRARLRFTVSAGHSAKDIDTLRTALHKLPTPHELARTP